MRPMNGWWGLNRYVTVGAILLAVLAPAAMQAQEGKLTSNSWAADRVTGDLLRAIDQAQKSAIDLTDALATVPVQKMNDRLIVEVVFEPGLATTLQGVTLKGATVLDVFPDYDRATVSLDSADAVLALAQLPGVLQVRPSYGANTNAGIVTSEAVAAHNVDVVRQRFVKDGRVIDGRGQRVGILSDSFATTQGVRTGVTTPALGVPGVLRGARNQVSGDLPSEVVILRDLTAVASDEGAGMAELVYDIAPGASQAFHTAFISEADFANGIRRLRTEAGSTVIVDDVIYFAEPMFQDGIVAREARASVEAGVPFFSSAGNGGNSALSFQYVDSNPDADEANLNQRPTGVDFHRWGNGQTFLPVTIIGGQSIAVSMQWNQPYQTVPGSQGSQIDFDIHFYERPSTNSAIVFSSNNLQGNTGAPAGDPLELVQLFNPRPQPLTVYMAVDHFWGNKDRIPQNADTPVIVRIVFFGFSPRIEGIVLDTNVAGASTMFGHAVAPGVMSVGAVPWYDTNRFNPGFGATTFVDPEDFTALGGMLSWYFNDAGQFRLRTAMEPDIAAVDGNNTTFFGSRLDLAGYNGEPDAFPNFFGTSAAAPNAAAIAALMKDVNPALTPAQIEQIMKDTAFDVRGRRAAPGVDDVTGSGLIDAARIMELGLGLRPIVEPTPTPAALQRRSFEFSSTSENWFFETVTPAFSAPIGSFRSGELFITATSSVNNFGFFTSPAFRAGAWQGEGDIPLNGGTGDNSLYRLTYTLSSSVPASNASSVPTVRLRTSTTDFQRGDVVVISSVGTAPLSPTQSKRTYRLFSSLPANSSQYRAHLDMLNVDLDNSPSATIFMDRVVVDALAVSNLAGQRFERFWDFANNANGWTQTPVAGLGSAQFTVTADGLGIGPSVSSGTTFAFWQSPSPAAGGAINLASDRLYRARFRVATNSNTPETLPAFRLRMNDETLNYSAYVNVESTSSASELPTAGSPREYQLFFEGRSEIEASRLLFAFDYLMVQGSGNDANASVSLQSLTVDSFSKPF